MSVDCIYYEQKENRHGNTGFYSIEGFDYSKPKSKKRGCLKAAPHKMEIATLCMEVCLRH